MGGFEMLAAPDRKALTFGAAHYIWGYVKQKLHGSS